MPVAAVALDACIVEEHFTLFRSVSGPDSIFSLEPDEFKDMVEAICAAEEALGSIHYGVGDHVRHSRVFCRFLFVVRDMKVGEMFTTENVRSIRPGYGLHTRYFDDVVGRLATRDIERGTPLSWDLLGTVAEGE